MIAVKLLFALCLHVISPDPGQAQEMPELSLSNVSTVVGVASMADEARQDGGAKSLHHPYNGVQPAHHPYNLTSSVHHPYNGIGKGDGSAAVSEWSCDVAVTGQRPCELK